MRSGSTDTFDRRGSSDAPAVEICANGAVAVPTLTYPNETAYVPVPAGALHVQVFPAGTACSSSGALIDATPTLLSGQFYTIAATGSLKTGVRPQVLQNAGTNPSGSAAIRFVHFSPDAPAVIVTAQGAGTIFGPISFPNATGYLALPAGSYNVSVALASSPTTVVVNVPALQLQAGHIYAAYAVGFANSADSTNENYTAPNAPAVDVAVANGPVIFRHVAFGTSSQYTSVKAGTYNLVVRPAGSKTVVLRLSHVHLTSGAVYSVFAEGLVGSAPALRAVVSVDRPGGM